MTTNRSASEEETQVLSIFSEDTHVIPRIPVPSDPLSELIDRVGDSIVQAVDSLQIAAFLESQGMSDRSAEEEYGYANVFHLAEELFARLRPHEHVQRRIPLHQDIKRAVLDVTHGLLYLLPCAVFPAVLTVVSKDSLIAGLVLVGGLAWMLAGASSWLAYRLLGAGLPGRAGWVLRWSALGGIPLAVGIALGVVLASRDNPWLVAFAAGQMAYQMASTLLMFYRKEILLIPIMLPAVVASIAYLVFGSILLPLAIGVTVVSIFVALGLGIWETMRMNQKKERALQSVMKDDLSTLPWVTAYSLFSAAFFLHAQTPYMIGHVDISFAALPLIIGMGVVEWRARRFGERVRMLTTRLFVPQSFVKKVWQYLFIDFACCVVIVALLAVPLTLTLNRWIVVSSAGMVMMASYSVIAGVYLLGFLLAEQSRYEWLCFSLAFATISHIVIRIFLVPSLNPLIDAFIYFFSALLLLVLFFVALAKDVGQIWRYR